MTAWYEESFGKDYLLVYKHRDMEGASAEVRKMIRWLGLPPGAKVLDLCCGMGRHALALAEAGYRVTGIDLSETLLQEARRQDTAHSIDWHAGDMRSLPFEDDTFRAVVNFFTSFGYFEDDRHNLRVLEEMHRVLEPGGRFLVDFLNEGYVRQHLVPYSVREETGLKIEETREIEGGFVRKQIIVNEPGQTERRYIEQVKLYGVQELTGMLHGAGLQVDLVYGGYDGQEYRRDESARLILIGTKREGQAQ
ncbi:class I SAM-dependent methyltransferase [Paenibacillus koleovorans]|uniref:class I SAM-dependent methyltransferase n=1 Tax=Paenibacillus koleovorans TaxID=121608 RepID=UPI000FD8B677|nr:class I SAM-dependent methyltransferase [Paenibacillus koleovorans]